MQRRTSRAGGATTGYGRGTSTCQNGRQVVGVLLVPGDPQEGCKVGRLVQDGGVFEGPQIEHTEGSVRAHGPEHVLATRKGNVVDFLVVRNELGFGLKFVDVPDGAGGVY